MWKSCGHPLKGDYKELIVLISPAKPSVFSKKKRTSSTANTAPAAWFWKREIEWHERPFGREKYLSLSLEL